MNVSPAGTVKPLIVTELHEETPDASLMELIVQEARFSWGLADVRAARAKR